ncbi:MAG: type II toxin-antitoxin system RelE/ParE family toxin [Candidatus Adiutrix sp.]|jgi:hypothetical protein|nr:type II toxin-antitoxin system RelE/ParE family toxin [Candidatus Adiutrix sp.]
MEFIESKHFAKDFQNYLSEDDYLDLQILLIARPEQGDLIPGGGGIRKIRFAAQGKGKRGGVRIIYFWLTREGIIHLLDIYPKSRQSDLSDTEIANLAKLVKEFNHDH